MNDRFGSAKMKAVFVAASQRIGLPPQINQHTGDVGAECPGQESRRSDLAQIHSTICSKTSAEKRRKERERC